MLILSNRETYMIPLPNPYALPKPQYLKQVKNIKIHNAQGKRKSSIMWFNLSISKIALAETVK